MHQHLRHLLDDYLRMYTSRDDRLTAFFSEDFSGFTGGGDFLVKDKARWVAITRQDFAQVKDPIRIELKDVAIQSLTETIAVATSFFTIHLPIKEHILSRKTARLVLIFRQETTGWKIAHCSISIPYDLVQEGEVYPIKEVVDRTLVLEELVAERTVQLSQVNDQLHHTNEQLAREVAERAQAGRALQQSEQLYRSILNASPDNITITDRAGRIVMFSPAARAMFGVDSDAQSLGHLVTDFIAPADRARAMEQVSARLNGIDAGPSEYVGLRPDGSTFDIEVNSDFIRAPGGEPTGMVVIVRDITQRKQAEAERRKLETQNRQLLKADSLSRMAAAIAHHFNNQLQAVMMSLELAQADQPRDEEASANLANALQSARKAAEMSRLMLTYLGQTVATPRALDLSQTCHDCLTLLRAGLPSQVTVEAHLPVSGPLIQADRDQIRQVLASLLTNAWEAGGAAPAVIHVSVATVTAAAIPSLHRFPVGGEPQDTRHACLEIRDTGCGIPGRDLEAIFDPFFSSKFTGRGMGLAVVLGIVRALDGFVTVESTPGQGSSFRIFLPLPAATTQQP